MKTAPHSSISLGDMQQEFQRALLDQQRQPPAFIVDTSGVSSRERFAVYSEAYSLRLIEALSADYPVSRDYLGDHGFDGMARAYIHARPSGQFSIRWFGRHLPSFLAETQPYDRQTEVQELAAFEWALSEAFDAPDSIPVGYQQLAGIAPEHWPELRLQFHPSMRRIDLRCNAAQVWQASNQQEPLPALSATIDRQSWIIWRQDLKLLFRSLSIQEAAALDAFKQGQCFAEACESLCAWLEEEQVAVSAAGFLQAWLRDGWIAGVKLTDGRTGP